MATDKATTEDYVTSRRHRKKLEMLFAHLKRILTLDRLRLRGPADRIVPVLEQFLQSL